MKGFFESIIGVELATARLYVLAAKVFSGDTEFVALLNDLSADEREHAFLIQHAMIAAAPGQRPKGIDIEGETDAILGRIRSCAEGLSRRDLSANEFISIIADLETSEVNDLFLFIIRALKGNTEYSRAASNALGHMERIRSFVASRPGLAGLLERLYAAPPLPVERVLIADDEEEISSLMAIFLSREFAVDRAATGSAALEKIRHGRYSVIISDVDMPGLNGIELFKAATVEVPSLKKRFIFVTGALDPARLEFFNSEGLTVFNKPVSMRDIKNAAEEVIKRLGPL